MTKSNDAEWEKRGAAMERGRIQEQQNEELQKQYTQILMNCATGCGGIMFLIVVLIGICLVV